MTLVPSPEPGLVDESDDRAEARRLRVLFDGLPALIGYWDRDLRNVIANEAYVEWFGISPEQIRGLHISTIVGQAVYDKNIPYMERALAGHQQEFQRTLVDPSGRVRHSQVSYVPDVVDGEVVGLGVLVTDITSRVEAERQLNDAQDLAELGSWTLVPGTNEVWWSPQMYRIHGRDPRSFRPEPESLLLQVHPDDRERVVATVLEAGVSGLGYEHDYQIVRPDGQVREVLSRVRTELSEDGVVTRLTGVTQDITSSNRLARDLGRVNDELQQVNQLNADVLGVVGHDVRGPLALVLGQLEVLTETWLEATPEANIARVEKTLGAARRLSVLLDDILAMANFDSGAIATRPMQVSLAEVVTDALAGVHGGQDVEVRREGDPLGVVDPFHLRQMVANLVTNAVRYGAPPVAVTISASDGGSVIEVTDQGAGVPDEFVPHLFDRFTRPTEGGTSTHRPGTGFGLYIVRRLAEANGCRTSYDRDEASGSRFRLEVPADGPPGG
jgi:PAS domain S-box-containing protein